MGLQAFPVAEDAGDFNANPPRPRVACQALLSDGLTYCTNLARWRVERIEETRGGSSKWENWYCDPHVRVILGTAPSAAAQTIPDPPAPQATPPPTPPPAPPPLPPPPTS
jgi:hypothetical protein